ncbi:SPFH domain-containing protein [Ruminococcus sp.]|uniref:SPFH domain-containing protein n=1 Tax=Ruminococcus sp. TaxID=41978 RepID=UPI0025E76BFE|nr:SPFH domain-containing protein [Ruminococcus sp.]
MGLIRMLTSAVGSTFADQVVDYFRCEDMSTKILCQPGTLVKRNGTTNNASDGVISNGSRFDVAVNQAALLIENGKVHDFVIGTAETAGQYKYDSKAAPSLLGGGWRDFGASIKEIGRRFTAGGQSLNTMRLIYINLKPIPGNKVGFGKIPFRDGEMNLTLNAQGHGQYELQIINPMNFYENVVQNVNSVLSVDSPDGATVLGQLKADMTPKFQIALTKIAALKIPYDQLGAYPDELAAAMNEALREKWANKGIEITSLAIELNVDEESKKRIAKFQEAKTAGSDPSMLYAMDRMSINTAREAAANNSNGAMAGFMGMGMAGGMMGQPMDASMYQQQMMNQQAAAQAAQQAAPAQAPAAAPTQQAAPTDGWTCACGATNTGKFCANCGQPKPEPKPAPTSDSWTCACGTENTGKFCANCGQPKPQKPEGWTCSCGAVNKGKFCAECGKPKPAAEPLYKCDKCGWEPADPKNPPKFCPECGDPFDDNDIKN